MYPKKSLGLLVSGALAVVLAIVALAGVALAVSGGWVHKEVADKSVVAVCLLGVLLSGGYFLKGCERGFVVLGSGVGAVAWLVLVAAGAICFGGVGGAGEMLGPGIGCLAGGLLAGVLRALGGGTKKRSR